MNLLEIPLVEVVLTRRCYIKCGYCKLVKDQTEMEIDYWERVFDFIKDKVHFVNLAGAEPLLYREICKIVDILNERKFSYTISTTALDKGMLKKVIDRGVNGISVSVDSLKDNWYDKASELKTKAALSSLDILEKAKLKFIGMTVTKKNYNEVEDTIKFFSNKGFMVCVNLLHGNRTDSNLSRGLYEYCLDTDQIRKLADLLLELLEKNYITADGPEVYETWLKDMGWFGWKCQAGSTLLIDSDGSIGACLEYKPDTELNLFKDWGILKSKDWGKNCGGCLFGCKITASLVKGQEVSSNQLSKR